jgi:hypothetical protein
MNKKFRALAQTDAALKRCLIQSEFGLKPIHLIILNHGLKTLAIHFTLKPISAKKPILYQLLIKKRFFYSALLSHFPETSATVSPAVTALFFAGQFDSSRSGPGTLPGLKSSGLRPKTRR